MGTLGMIGIVLSAISFIFYMSARREVEGDYRAGRTSASRMLKLRRYTGQALAFGVLLILVSVATHDEAPGKNEVATPNEDVVEADVDSQTDEVIELGPYSVAAIPNGVPSAYQMQYEELTDIISRADATLTFIKDTISSCEAPCGEPLSEIGSKFDAMNDVIEETRNELFRGSEIARVMAEEDPAELHTQKLYELQQELLSTRSSLETMLIADSWESWEEPIEYAESTRVKRLYKITLADTILTQQISSQESKGSIDSTRDTSSEEAEYFKAIALTVEQARVTMSDVSALSYMCGNICPDVPGDTWALQLEVVNNEIFGLQRSMYQFAEEIRLIPESSSENINFNKRDELANEMELFADSITPIMLKQDWASWDEAHSAVDEAIALLDEMHVGDVYTVPTIN